MQPVTEQDKSAEALLLFQGDTLARQQIESTSYFDPGYFSFSDLKAGSYDLILRKPGFNTRHFQGISLTPEKSEVSASINLYARPTWTIDSLSYRIFYDGPRIIDSIGLDIQVRLSSFAEEASNYYLGLFSRSPEVSPGTHDFFLNLQAYTPESVASPYLRASLFDQFGYQPGDTLHAFFIPQTTLYLPNNYLDQPFGEAVMERGTPSLAPSQGFRTWALVP